MIPVTVQAAQDVQGPLSAGQYSQPMQSVMAAGELRSAFSSLECNPLLVRAIHGREGSLRLRGRIV